MQKGCLDETTLLFEGTTPRFVQAMQQIFFLWDHAYAGLIPLAQQLDRLLMPRNCTSFPRCTRRVLIFTPDTIRHCNESLL